MTSLIYLTTTSIYVCFPQEVSQDWQLLRDEDHILAKFWFYGVSRYVELVATFYNPFGIINKKIPLC